MTGLIGKKIGMTQVYDDKGHRVAVTVIEAGPCTVIQRKIKNIDGYDAVQLGFGEQKEHRTNKALLVRFKKAGTTPKKYLREILPGSENNVKMGDIINASIFDGISHVDVIGVSKGRGFQGVVKRYRMAGGRMTHGGHSKRRVGSIGQCSYPARVAKGQKMPGHMGNARRTIQNLKIVELRVKENLIFIKGAVPGPAGTVILINKALKKKG